MMAYLLCSRRKSLAEFAAEEQQGESQHQLTLFDLLCVGIGGTVGSGVFVLTGSVSPVAGPSAALCWMLGGCVCLLSALSYCELSVRVPSRGSTYSYSYHALGELAAVAGATSLTLEYGLSGAGVARSWSLKFADLLGISFSPSPSYSFDFGAAGIQVLCVLVVLRGVSLSKRVVNVLTVSKVGLVLFLIVAGMSSLSYVFGGRSSDTFFRHGAAGVVKGTSLLFFGFIGFDEVCCMAARCQRPQHALPRAIVGTLLGTAILSTLAQLSLSGLILSLGQNQREEDEATNPYSFERAFRLKGWYFAKYAAQIGEVILLPLVVLLSFLPQPELMAALGADGFVSSRFARLGGKRGDVYVFGCAVCGLALTTVSLVVPFDVLWNMINLGVLIGFNITNTSLISARLGNAGKCVDPQGSATLGRFTCVYAPLAAYVGWKGYGHDAIEGRHVGATGYVCLGVATLFCFAGIVTLAGIDRKLSFLTRTAGKVAPPWIFFESSSTIGAPSSSPVLSSDDDDDDEEDEVESGGALAFRAPGVPWVPGAAIFLNFLLMAQYAWIDHAYLAILYGSAYAVYFHGKHAQYAKAARRREEEEGDEGEEGEEGTRRQQQLETPLIPPGSVPGDYRN